MQGDRASSIKQINDAYLQGARGSNVPAGNLFPMTYSINRVSMDPDFKPTSPQDGLPVVKKTYSQERLSPVVDPYVAGGPNR